MVSAITKYIESHSDYDTLSSKFLCFLKNQIIKIKKRDLALGLLFNYCLNFCIAHKLLPKIIGSAFIKLLILLLHFISPTLASDVTI